MTDMETMAPIKPGAVKNTAVETISILLMVVESRDLGLEGIFKSPELRVVRVKDFKEATHSLAQGKFACILLDGKMPGISGLKLSRLIKKSSRQQNMPVIFFTAPVLDDREILQGYEAGAVDYLTKPVNAQILKSKVRAHVGFFRTAQALSATENALQTEIQHRKNIETALRRATKKLESAEKYQAGNGLDRKQWEERLRHLAAIVEFSDDAIISLDLKGIVTSWNDGARRIFGYGAGEIVGKPVLVLIPQEQQDEELRLLERIRKGEGVERHETIRRRKDGTLIEISLTVSPIKNSGGKIIGASKIARDITERKRVENELRKAHGEILAAVRGKDAILARLSHELRTPLNPVLLIASDAVNNYELPPRVRMDFDTIRKNTELEARLIDDLLDLTCFTRGKVFLDKRFVDVHLICRDAAAQMQEEINQKKIVLELKLAAQQSGVLADPVRLQQVFWNLLKNAVKFTPKHGRIMVETETSGNDQIIIRVTDTGIGIEPGETDRIFNTFSQENRASHFIRLGLGLAISKRLVEFHAGRIRADSQGRGQGATITVELPLAKPAGKSGDTGDLPDETLRAKAPGKIRILLVEDHAPTRKILVQLLMRRHYEVAAAASVAEALASPKNFHVLISDIGLPDGNGYDLMIELRKHGAFPGIALTGFGMEQDVARSQQAGFLMHLTKPVKIQSLEKALMAAIQSMPDLPAGN
jgi:PAS domain S-box-containing protein